jgi:hypothetical protein
LPLGFKRLTFLFEVSEGKKTSEIKGAGFTMQVVSHVRVFHLNRQQQQQWEVQVS